MSLFLKRRKEVKPIKDISNKTPYKIANKCCRFIICGTLFCQMPNKREGVVGIFKFRMF